MLELNGLQIIIVEDDWLIAASHRSTIEEAGGTVIGPARSGEEAIKLAKTHRPDVILMDIQLAGNIDGIDAAERILADNRIPIIFVTGNSDPAVVERIRALGNPPTVFKPAAPEQLVAAVSKVCRRPKITLC